MKKITAAILALILICLTACAPEIPNGYDRQQLTDQSQAVLESINIGDYEAVISCLRQDVRDEISLDDLAQAYDGPIADAGQLVSIKSTDFSVSNDQTTGETYCTVKLKCRYENGSYTFSVTFNRAMEIIGMYLK